MDESMLFEDFDVNAEAILLLLHNKKMDPNGADKSKSTHLYCACARDMLEVVQLLLNHGADPNKISAHGETPLHAACKSNRYEIAKLLLEYKANPNILDDVDRAPIFYTCRHGYPKLAQLLLNHGADPNNGLGRVLSTVHDEIARMLIRHGADITIRIVEDHPYMKPHYEAQRELKYLLLFREKCEDSLLSDSQLPRDLFRLICKEVVRAHEDLFDFYGK